MLQKKDRYEDDIAKSQKRALYPTIRKIQNNFKIPFYASDIVCRRKDSKQIFWWGLVKKLSSFTVDGNIFWLTIMNISQHEGYGFCQKIRVELQYVPVVHFLSINSPMNFISSIKTLCKIMFIAMFSTIAKMWKQPKCLMTGERIKSKKKCSFKKS